MYTYIYIYTYSIFANMHTCVRTCTCIHTYMHIFVLFVFLSAHPFAHSSIQSCVISFGHWGSHSVIDTSVFIFAHGCRKLVELDRPRGLQESHSMHIYWVCGFLFKVLFLKKNGESLRVPSVWSRSGRCIWCLDSPFFVTSKADESLLVPSVWARLVRSVGFLQSDRCPCVPTLRFYLNGDALLSR